MRTTSLLRPPKQECEDHAVGCWLRINKPELYLEYLQAHAAQYNETIAPSNVEGDSQ